MEGGGARRASHLGQWHHLRDPMGGRFFHPQEQERVAVYLTQLVCEGILVTWVREALAAKSAL